MQQQLTRLKALYSDYVNQSREIRRKAPFGAGLFSPQKDPRNHPCHDQFYDAVGALLLQLPEADPTEVVRWMLEAPLAHPDEDAYWYLLAAQGHARPLIPRMAPAARRELGAWFAQAVPKRERLPIQEEILKLLMK